VSGNLTRVASPDGASASASLSPLLQALRVVQPYLG
jgi:hypothetical protein